MVAYVTGIANNLQLVDLILYIYNNIQNPEPDTDIVARKQDTEFLCFMSCWQLSLELLIFVEIKDLTEAIK